MTAPASPTIPPVRMHDCIRVLATGQMGLVTNPWDIQPGVCEVLLCDPGHASPHPLTMARHIASGHAWPLRTLSWVENIREWEVLDRNTQWFPPRLVLRPPVHETITRLHPALVSLTHRKRVRLQFEFADPAHGPLLFELLGALGQKWALPQTTPEGETIDPRLLELALCIYEGTHRHFLWERIKQGIEGPEELEALRVGPFHLHGAVTEYRSAQNTICLRLQELHHQQMASTICWAAEAMDCSISLL